MNIQFKHFDSIESTQLEAQYWIKHKSEQILETLPDSIVLTATEQSGGIGQGQNSWVSEKGGLYFTMITPTPPQTPIDEWPAILGEITERSIGTQFQEAIEAIPPNDFYLNGKKIGGMLIEHHTITNTPFMLIGIGINVNQADFPTSVYSTATSIYRETQKEFPIEESIQKLCQDLISEINQ